MLKEVKPKEISSNSKSKLALNENLSTKLTKLKLKYNGILSSPANNFGEPGCSPSPSVWLLNNQRMPILEPD